MIPKIIHYCWLSDDPIPTSLKKCMKTWKNVLPDYEWIKWDFNRFDKSSSVWVMEAFDNRKYAFAADYIRLYALYNYGGFYLDMDVIAKKSLNPFLDLSTVICWQNGEGAGLEVAAFGVEKHSAWVKSCLESYKGKHFINSKGNMQFKVLPNVIEDHLRDQGFKLVNVNTIDEAKSLGEGEIPVFPCQFFSPKNWNTGKLESDERTVLIHDFAGSWLPKEDRKKYKERVFQQEHRFLFLFYYYSRHPLQILKILKSKFE